MEFSRAFVGVLVILVLGWLIGLSVLFFRAISNYNRLTSGTNAGTLSDILTKFLDKEGKIREELRQLLGEVTSLRQEAKGSVQKIGLVRFNPFSDTGGDQSFALALLDGENNGIVVTSLYARTGVRWYVKKVKHGRGVEHEISKEEEEAVKKATRQK